VLEPLVLLLEGLELLASAHLGHRSLNSNSGGAQNSGLCSRSSSNQWPSLLAGLELLASTSTEARTPGHGFLLLEGLEALALWLTVLPLSKPVFIFSHSKIKLCYLFYACQQYIRNDCVSMFNTPICTRKYMFILIAWPSLPLLGFNTIGRLSCDVHPLTHLTKWQPFQYSGIMKTKSYYIVYGNFLWIHGIIYFFKKPA